MSFTDHPHYVFVYRKSGSTETHLSTIKPVPYEDNALDAAVKSFRIAHDDDGAEIIRIIEHRVVHGVHEQRDVSEDYSDASV